MQAPCRQGAATDRIACRPMADGRRKRSYLRRKPPEARQRHVVTATRAADDGTFSQMPQEPERETAMAQKRSNKKNISGWLVLEQALRHELDRGGRQGALADAGEKGRTCRHARSAGDRDPADRLRRGDQDRAAGPGRHQGLPVCRHAGGSRRRPTTPKARVVATSDRRPWKPRSWRRCCRASPG